MGAAIGGWASCHSGAVHLGGLDRVAQELGGVNGAREGVVTQQLRTCTCTCGGGGAGAGGGGRGRVRRLRLRSRHGSRLRHGACGTRGTCGVRRGRTASDFSFESGRPRRTLPCGGLRLPRSRGTQPAATASTSARPVPLASPCRGRWVGGSVSRWVGGSVRRCFSLNQPQS